MDLDQLKLDRGPGPKRAHRRRFPWLTVLLFGGVAAALWFFRMPLLELAQGSTEAIEVRTARVELVAAGSRSAVEPVSGAAANGYVVARRRAALSADTPGRIIELNVEEGSVVSKGDVVARLYADELEAALRRAESELAVAEVAVRASGARVNAAGKRLDEAKAFVGNVASQRDEVSASVDLALREHDRAKALVDRGAVPRELFERAESALIQARARLAAAESGLVRTQASVATAESDVDLATLEEEQTKAGLEPLRAAVDLARATLDKTYVRAPFDGVVVLKDAEVGEVVSPNALGGQSRGSVATMVDFSTLEIQVELPEQSLGSVQVGRPADVFIDAFSTERLGGTVLRIWPTANRQKATIEVRVGLESIDPRLRPEMGARVVFAPAEEPVDSGPEAESAEPRLLIPSSALVERDGVRGVFLVDGGVARFTPVTAGSGRGARVAVESGLVAGQEIVARPPAPLTDGTAIQRKP